LMCIPITVASQTVGNANAIFLILLNVNTSINEFIEY
jgi:hypothetical protein